MSLVLGIDSSTTATKAILVDEEGTVVSVASSSYEYQTPQPSWSEQDPSLWWDGAVESIRVVLDRSGTSPEDIDAVGLTGQMHRSVLLDSDGEVIRPAILWNDREKIQQASEVLKLTAPSLLEFKIVDGIVPEPEGGAQLDHDGAARNLKEAILKSLLPLLKLSPSALEAQRYEKFRAMGLFQEK